MLFDLPKEEPNIIKIIGVGGGGSNAVTHMFKQGIIGVDYCICNTDAQAMEYSAVPNRIQLGYELTEGRGAGSKPEVGKNACIESIEEVKTFLNNGTRMVFITAGMGGGTGTGAAPIIAKTAQEMGILTVGIVTLPFTFEGRTRVNNGYDGLEELRQNVDCLVVISNDKLRQIHPKMTISKAFAQADNILGTAAKGIAEIITVPGYVNVDFEDVNTVMRDSGVAILGTATAEGEGRARRAVDEALNSPLLEDNNIAGAQNILVNITSGKEEATMEEIFEITEFVQNETGDGANLIWGNCYDERLGDALSVTIIATGFEASKKIAPIPAKKGATIKPAKPTRQVVHLDEEPIAASPSIEEVTAEKTDAELEINQATIEFENDNIRETIERLRREEQSQEGPYVRDGAVDERRRRVEYMEARREQIRQRPIDVVKLSSPQTVIELENQPAYLRRKVNLDMVRHSETRDMSDVVLSMKDDEVTMKPNSYLHDRPD